MQVSVVVPVYNAEEYLAKAVNSALSQTEVDEIILAEDNSPDNSLEICKALASENKKVKLVRHPNFQNLGAAETRNLGIKNSSYEFVAFLDADDYYLPDRFKIAKQIFSENENIDGVYEAVGMHYYSDSAKKKWISQNGEKLTTVTKDVNPDEFFEFLLEKGSGYIHLDGLVVKKQIFEKCGYFPSHLRLHQDTAIIFQLAGVGRMQAGRLNTAVANRGIHDENRILSEYNRSKTNYQLWHALYKWSKDKHLTRSRRLALSERYLTAKLRLWRENNEQNGNSGFERELLFECFFHPLILIRVMWKILLKK